MDPELRQKRSVAMREQLNRAVICGKVGEGTYGVVMKARYQQSDSPDQVSSDFIAVKTFKPVSVSISEGFNKDAIREVALLKELDHPNIIKLRDVIICPPTVGNSQGSNKAGLSLVFDYAEHDLYELLKHHRDSKLAPPNEVMVKSVMYQILNGLAYLHSNWVIHRDLKPSNILVMGRSSSEVGRVKLADFGMARIFQSPLRPLHHDGVVVTIWYRAPELLLGTCHYTTAIDIWAVGCIFAELITSFPIFRGQEEKKATAVQLDQLNKIFAVLGSPSVELWPGMAVMKHFKAIDFTKRYDNRLEANLKQPKESLSPDALRKAVDLISKMLTYDPAIRISAADALHHPFFEPNNHLTNIFHNCEIEYPCRKLNSVDSTNGTVVSLGNGAGTNFGVGSSAQSLLQKPAKIPKK